MTKVKMQKVEILAEFDCGGHGRWDAPNLIFVEAVKRCDGQTYQQTSGKKKQDSGPPLEMNEFFLEVLTEIITRGNDN